MARVRYGYTQNEEEKYIVETLSNIKKGRFLDIGAHDGITFSSTRKLWELGWTGVYVEPSPDVLPNLYKNIDSTTCTVLPVAISNSCGSMEFYSAGDDMVGALSTSVEHINRWTNLGVSFKKTTVESITIQELATRVGSNFDFINIDVEGCNVDILNQFDWSIWNPRCICIEYDSQIPYITNLMEKHGYKVIYTSPENLVLIKIPTLTFVNFANTDYYIKTRGGLVETAGKFGYPTQCFSTFSEIDSPSHQDNPYAFKLYAIDKARKKGFDIVIWCDSPQRLLKPITDWVPEIERVGVYLQEDGWKIGQWANDKSLNYFNITRDQAMTMPNVYACVMAFDFRTKIAHDFLNEMFQCEKEGLFKGSWNNDSFTESTDPRCKGHRHDQTCAELVANKLNIPLQPLVFSYESYRYFTAWHHMPPNPSILAYESYRNLLINAPCRQWDNDPISVLDKKLKNSSPMFSIVMPIHNQETIIQSVITSILINTVGYYEIILIIDGCNDSTKQKVLELFNNEDVTRLTLTRIRIIENVRGIFETSSDNQGFIMSDGKYIIEIQADMRIMSYGYNVQLTTPMEIFDDIIGVSGRCCHSINNNSTSTNCGKLGTLADYPHKSEFHQFNSVILSHTANRGPLAIRKSMLHKLGYLDEQHYVLDDSDHDLFMRAWHYNHWRVGFVPVEVFSPLKWGVTRKPRIQTETSYLDSRSTKTRNGFFHINREGFVYPSSDIRVFSLTDIQNAHDKLLKTYVLPDSINPKVVFELNSGLNNGGGFFAVFFFMCNAYIHAKKNNLEFSITNKGWPYGNWNDYFTTLNHVVYDGLTNYIRCAHMELDVDKWKYPLEEYSIAIKDMFQLNSTLINRANKILESLGTNYKSIFVRRGDKVTECPNIPLADILSHIVYNETTKFFIQTDDYSVVEEFRNILPQNTIISTVPENKRGSYHSVRIKSQLGKYELISLEEKSKEQKNIETEEMLVGLYVCANSNECWTDSTSNVGRFLKLYGGRNVHIYPEDIEININSYAHPAWSLTHSKQELFG
jgi:FkbM family methyltransferase